MALDEHFDRRSREDPLEIRGTPRVAVSLAASLTLGGGGAIPCRLRDLGTGGACVETLSPFALSSLRGIALQLPGRLIELDVEGRWQNVTSLEHAMLTGLRFVRPSPDETKEIREFVHELANTLTRFLENESDLSVLALDEAMDLALSSRLREAEAGSYICLQGSSKQGEDSVFVVLRGSVAIEAAGSHEHELTLERVYKGGLFGGISLVANVPPPLSAVAAEQVTLIELDRGSFRHLERSKPIVAERVAEVVVAKTVGHLRSVIDRLLQHR